MRINIMMGKVNTLRKDMSLKEATEIMGGPGEKGGSMLVIIRYSLSDKSYVLLNFRTGG